MISKINTSCKDCIFAIYEGITQTGCKTGELDKMRDHGIQILEAYDNDKEFFVINKTKCLYNRPKEWPLANGTLEEQVAHILKCIRIIYEIIIVANDNIDDLKLTINSALAQTLPPKQITIIRRHECKILPSELYHLCKDLPLKWKVENCIRTSPDNIELLDMIIPFSTNPICAMFYAGFEIPLTTFEQINYQIHENFLRMTLVMPNSTGNGLVVPAFIHKCYQGSYQKSLIEKLKDDECPYLIPITQIVENFPA